jgi:hypothetical protein
MRWIDVNANSECVGWVVVDTHQQWTGSIQLAENEQATPTGKPDGRARGRDKLIQGLFLLRR